MTEKATDVDAATEAVWDPVAQIYVGGQVPENAAVTEMLKKDGALRVFGYGSLCWKPGGILAHPKVRSMLGQARGYRRCWAQKSTDHRGVPTFPGLVCTLLTESEVQQLRADAESTIPSAAATACFTEGVLYVVPPELVDECLAELDFREKGGYARDVIDVEIENSDDANGGVVQALLYRGTPDNPALWPRALQDLPYAAAILAVAVGPSGPNDEYLQNLNGFLVTQTAAVVEQLQRFDDTIALAALVRHYQQSRRLYFLYGAGSNQHNQLLLLLPRGHSAIEEDAHTLQEVLLCVPRDNDDDDDPPTAIFAGGGHSAVLTTRGRLYLFGWNEQGQLGRSSSASTEAPASQAPKTTIIPPPPPATPALDCDGGLRVETCALGFDHTLVIERDTQCLWGMGNNIRGQVTGQPSSIAVSTPVRVTCLDHDEPVTSVACGLHHSAAITERDGQLVVWGQATRASNKEQQQQQLVRRWSPPHGKRLQRVACGRRHTVVLDEDGAVYTLGDDDNKHGQLGRRSTTATKNEATTTADHHRKDGSTPQPVPLQVDDAPWTKDGFTVVDIQCGWSHTVVLARKSDGTAALYGWGRNDKGQLGVVMMNNTNHDNDDNQRVAHISTPQRLSLPTTTASHIRQVACGSEFTLVVDEDDAVWGTGWNEHGNLAQGQPQDDDVLSWVQVVAEGGLAIGNPPTNGKAATALTVAAGGGHFLAMRTVTTNNNI